ncbi:MAG: hypothetical protein J6K89_08845, partial [Oscillospiraceae bacterium]|nr:hypothetical protein [Oscillospiraceae bacterium]
PTTGHTISRLLFDVIEENKGYSGTKVEIDYVYFGPSGSKPSAQAADTLLFHFDNKMQDQLRYAGTVYGDRNYDTDFWAGNAARIGTISYGNSGLKFPFVDGSNFAYIQTTEGNKNLVSVPLSYKPAANDMVQVKLKLENLQAVSGQTPTVKLHYIKNNSTAGVANADYTEIQKLTSTHFNGQEFVITAKLNDTFTSASVINAIRLGFENMTNVSGKTGTVTIDYIAIGQLASLPVPAVPCTVTFKDESGKILETQSVSVGSSVTYGGSTPIKAYDATNHYTFSGWVNQDGTSANLSAISGDSVFYASFKATAHSFKEEIINAPTCTATGLKRYTCTTCGYSYNSDPIPSTGHTPVTDKGYAATCTTPGLSDGSHCSVCNTVLMEQTVIPAKGHTEVIVPGYAPTCLNSGMSDGIICSVCQMVIQAQEAIARLGHNYIYTDNHDGTHTGICQNCNKVQSNKTHTYDENGVCTLCGSGSASTEIDNAVVLRHSLNLASDISINYLVEASQLSAYNSLYLECVIPTYEGNAQVGTSTITIEPELKGNYYYFTLNGLTAVQMNDKISATLHMDKAGAKYLSQTDTYSVADYAYAQLKKTDAAESLRALCAELLRYGAKAQIFKGYRLSNLADAELSLAHLALLNDLDSVSFASNNQELNDLQNPSVLWVGKSLDLNSKVTVKYVFNANNFSDDPKSLSLRVSFKNISGETVNYTLTDPKLYNPTENWYAFDLDSLLAAELRSVVSASIYSGNQQVSTTMVYSADTYGNGKEGNLLTLCKALFSYSDTAKEFFQNN